MVVGAGVPPATVEAVIEAAGAREQRVRMLPAWLVVSYVLALALFMDMGGGRVMRKLAETLAWADRGVTVAIPSEEALSRALIAARIGSFATSEKALTIHLLPRSVPGHDLWGQAAGTGADLLGRVGSAFPLPAKTVKHRV